MAGLHFDITGDNSNFLRKLEETRNGIRSTSKQIEESGMSIEQMFGRLAKGAAGFGIAFSAKELISNIVRVRGEFQSMQTAMETMVGKDIAGPLMAQIKELAKISPLTMTDMVGAEKMMLGFNIQAEDTVKYLKALSDISMGESGKFNSLTLAFSQMSATGKLMGQDLNQMINAGFNPLQTIAEKTGKSIATLKDEMSKGAISAEMVQQAFLDATAAGGKFYNMSENASKTINGQISMMQDALDNVFNELGTKGEGVIMGSIQATTSLIQNYETIGKVLTSLIATYGSYRAALMLTAATSKGYTVVQLAQYNILLAVEKAQKLLNATILANPYVLLATAVVGVVTAMWAFHDSSTEMEKAQKRLNEQQEEAQRIEEEHRQKIDSLVESLREISLSDLQRGQSLAELRKEYPKIFAQYDIETIKLADILKLKQQIAEEDTKQAGEKRAKEFSDIESEIKYYEKLLKSLAGKQGTDGYVKKLTQLRLDRDVMLQHRGKDISEQFISSLKNIDVNEFDRYLGELEKRIKGMGENGKVRIKLPIDAKGTLSDEAIYGIKDIKTLIDTTKAVKEAREEAVKADKKAGNEWLSLYKKQYEDADKAYKDFLESKEVMSDTDRDKELKRLKDLRDVAKTTFESKGGVTGSALTKLENQATNEAKKKLKLQQDHSDILLEISRNAKDRENAERQTAFEIEQAKIDIMEEGFEKEQTQIDLNHRKALQGIKQRGEEMVEAQQEAERKQWEKDGKKGVFTPKTMSVSQLSTEQLQQLAGLMNGVAAKTDHDSQELFDSMVKKYSTYTEQRKEIEKKFDDDIAAMQKKNTGGEYDANIKEADKLKTKALSDLDSSIIANKSMWSRLFSDTSAMSKHQIQSVIADIKKLTDYLEGVDATIPVGFTEEQLKSLRDDPEKIKAIYDELIKKQQELDDRTNYPLSGFTKGFNKLKESADLARKAMKATTEEEKRSLEYQAEAVKARGMQYIADGAVEAADGVSFLADNLKELAKATGDEHLSETAEQFSAIAQNFAAAGKGFQSGGWIGAIIGGATDMLTQTFEAFTTAKAEAKEYEDNRRDFLNEYNLLMLRNRISSEEQDNVFGSAAMKRAAEAAKAAQDALAQYTDEVTKRTAPELKKEFNSLGAAIFSGGMFGGWLGLGKRASDDYKKQLKAYKDGYTDLQAMAVKTRDYSGWANFWGKKDKYTLLKDLRPELWDKETGEFDIEAAKAFLETNTQINDEQRKSIQNVIDLKETYEDALQVLKDDVSDTFGTLGNDIIDSVVGAVQNGDIAIDKFAESVGKTFENLGKKIAYELFFHKEFEKLQEDLLKTYDLSDSETIANAQMDIVSRFFDTIGSKMDGAEEWLEKWKALAKEKGFDIFGSEETGKDWLGSTADSLTQSILDGLKAGKSGIKEFSDSFEDAMRTAVLNSIKMQYLEGPMKEFYKKFASLSESGGQLTATEIEELRNMYNDIVTGAMSQFDALKEISGLDFSDTSDNTLKGAYAKASQESITLIAGQFGHFGVVLEDIKNSMIPIREQMLAIREMNAEGWEDVKAIRDLSDKVEKNTNRIAENTQEIKTVADKISDNTKRTVETLEGRIDVNIKGM